MADKMDLTPYWAAVASAFWLLSEGRRGISYSDIVKVTNTVRHLRSFDGMGDPEEHVPAVASALAKKMRGGGPDDDVYFTFIAGLSKNWRGTDSEMEKIYGTALLDLTALQEVNYMRAYTFIVTLRTRVGFGAYVFETSGEGDEQDGSPR